MLPGCTSALLRRVCTTRSKIRQDIEAKRDEEFRLRQAAAAIAEYGGGRKRKDFRRTMRGRCSHASPGNGLRMPIMAASRRGARVTGYPVASQRICVCQAGRTRSSVRALAGARRIKARGQPEAIGISHDPGIAPGTRAPYQSPASGLPGGYGTALP